MLVARLCLTLCKPTRLLCPWDSPSRILEWTAIAFSRGSSQPRDQIWVSSIAGRILYCLNHRVGGGGEGSLERKTHGICTYQAKVLYFAATHSSLWWGFQWDYSGQTVLLLLTVHMFALKSLRTEKDQHHSLSILLHHLQPLKKKKNFFLHSKNSPNQRLRNSYPIFLLLILLHTST